MIDGHQMKKHTKKRNKNEFNNVKQVEKEWSQMLKVVNIAYEIKLILLCWHLHKGKNTFWLSWNEYPERITIQEKWQSSGTITHATKWRWHIPTAVFEKIESNPVQLCNLDISSAQNKFLINKEKLLAYGHSF